MISLVGKMDKKLLKHLEDLVENFPKPSTTEYIKEHGKSARYLKEYFNYRDADFSTYRTNQTIIDSVIYARNELLCIKDIFEEDRVEGRDLKVQLDVRV